MKKFPWQFNSGQIIWIHSNNHAKHKYKLCQNTKFLNVIVDEISVYYWDVNANEIQINADTGSAKYLSGQGIQLLLNLQTMGDKSFEYVGYKS